MCCEGCEKVVRNSLLKLKGKQISAKYLYSRILSPIIFFAGLGVDSVEVDLPMERVTVTGYVDRNKVLKTVRRSGKKAEFWPNPDLPLQFTSASDYFQDEESFRESYNYWRHGYNGEKHGQVPIARRGDDRVSNMFNDDDVHACSIM